jgi:uncharacterized protein YbdZ (MbtH family)
MADHKDEEQYRVVVNAERQYSIWPVYKENPLGWEDEGMKGSKTSCLEHIDKVWTDMRPLSLQKFMAQNAPKGTPKKIEIPKAPEDGKDYFHAPQPANDLVKRLMKEQPVELIRYKDADKLKKAAENGYVLVKFTGTQGGTELGANVKNDDPKCQVTFNEQEKTATIHGRLKLDFTPVHLIATINLDTFQGQGHLMVVDDWPRAK